MDSPKRARSRKRRILPRVALKVAEPVLYSTLFRAPFPSMCRKSFSSRWGEVSFSGKTYLW